MAAAPSSLYPEASDGAARRVMEYGRFNRRPHRSQATGRLHLGYQRNMEQENLKGEAVILGSHQKRESLAFELMDMEIGGVVSYISLIYEALPSRHESGGPLACLLRMSKTNGRGLLSRAHFAWIGALLKYPIDRLEGEKLLLCRMDEMDASLSRSCKNWLQLPLAVRESMLVVAHLEGPRYCVSLHGDIEARRYRSMAGRLILNPEKGKGMRKPSVFFKNWKELAVETAMDIAVCA